MTRTGALFERVAERLDFDFVTDTDTDTDTDLF